MTAPKLTDEELDNFEIYARNPTGVVACPADKVIRIVEELRALREPSEGLAGKLKARAAAARKAGASHVGLTCDEVDGAARALATPDPRDAVVAAARKFIDLEVGSHEAYEVLEEMVDALQALGRKP